MNKLYNLMNHKLDQLGPILETEAQLSQES